MMTTNENNLVLKVIIKPDEYIDFLHYLAKFGFRYISGQIPGDGKCVLEKYCSGKHNIAYTVRLTDKSVGYWPEPELYQPNSPNARNKEFEECLKQAISCDEAKYRIFKYVFN